VSNPIPAELCLAVRDLTEPRLSPQGTTVAFVSTWGSRAAICAVPVNGGPERPLTSLPEPRGGYGGACFCWLPDGSGIVYAAIDGDLWLQSLAAGEPIRLTERTTQTPAVCPAIDPTGGLVAYVDADFAELWVLERSTRRTRRIATEADFVVDPSWTPGGSLLWHEWSVPSMAWDESRIGVCDAPLRSPSADRWLGAPGFQAQQPRADGAGQVWSLRDDGGWLNLWRDDAAFVAEPCEHGGPTWGAGQRTFAPSPSGDAVAFTRNELGFGRLCTARRGPTGAVEVTELGRGVHQQLSWVGERIAATRSGARTPLQIVVHDLSAETRTVVACSAPSTWDSVTIDEPEPVAWSAGDGSVIPGRLHRAPEPTHRLICLLHGGPTSQAQVSFAPRIAYWTSRGWNVLVPDFRGTTGHGRAHQQAMRHGWGVVDVDDTIAGLRHAHAEGWGAPASTVLMGGSAGGFTALHVVHRVPDACRAAVVSYPVGDLVALDETTHRFEAHYNASLVGERPAADSEYLRRSPLTFADALTVPLLVLHGDDDRVVGVDQSRALVERMVAAGHVAELQVYEGEGHGFRRAATLLDEYRRTSDFLRRHVG
jgi:dipeptidyl aminopeptidase/acylaminoacyl peptidase